MNPEPHVNRLGEWVPLSEIAERVAAESTTVLNPHLAVLERDRTLLSLSLSPSSFDGWLLPSTPRRAFEGHKAAFLAALAGARIVLWRADLIRLAAEGAQEAWAGVPAPAWVADWQPEYWTIDRDLHMPPAECADHRVPAHYGPIAYLVGGAQTPSGRKMCSVTAIFAPLDGEPGSVEAAKKGDIEGLTPKVRQLGFAVAGEPLDQRIPEFIAAKAFLQTTVARTVDAAVPRGDRRRWEKEAKRDYPAVSVVTLRKAETNGKTDATAAERDFACHFLVRGHWRRNWREGRPPMFVQPYVKGDLEMPFKAPAHRVFDVKR